MDFRILGPLEVVDDGRPVALGGARQRALLAILLLRRGKLVPAARLVEELYGTEPPATAAKSLQAHVSRLRKAMRPADRVESRAGGYALRLEPGELDADRFETKHQAGRDALAEGRPQDAAAALADALALWRGPPLADLQYEEFAQGELAKLEELRLSCIEDRFDAELALGRSARVVADLEPLLSAHPFRERLRSQLILSLYRSGRQSEALEAYQSARTALIEGLGIEPGRALRDLHLAILRQDAALDLPAAPDPPDAPAKSSFVGREAELAELAAGLDDAVAGRGRLFLLAGEPGIGKSRLADLLAARARRHGARVLVGRCWEAGGAPAYWPWVQSLRTYLRECDPAALREQLGAGAADLAQLFPELHELVARLPAPPTSDAEGARFRLFDAAVAFVRRAAAAQPLVFVLDDLHAADEPSLLLLRFLARDLADARILVLVAYRDVDPSLRDPLVATLSELTREPVTRRIALRGLAESDVAEYLALTEGVEPDAATVAQIRDGTGGNPLFVGELVRLLAAEGRLDRVDGSVLVPPGIREVIGSRIRRLSEQSQDLLLLASVLGREFALDALERMHDVTRVELLDLLDEAMEERVVGDVPGAADRLRFAHALIRDTLYDRLAVGRRLELHRLAGETIELLNASDLEPHLAEIALHFSTAAPAGTRAKAIEYARRAGDRAVSLLAYEEAVRLYRLALASVEQDADRCDLLLEIGEAQARSGDTPSSKRTFAQAAELAESLRLPERLGRAALGYGSRMLWDVSRDDASLTPLLERAIAGLGPEDSDLRARLLARLAGGPLRDARFDPAQRHALSEQALAMARRIGNPQTVTYALAGYISAHHSPDHAREQVELAGELIEAAQLSGDLERAIEAHEHRFESLLELGDAAGASDDLDAMISLAARVRQPSQDWFVTEIRAHHALLQGRLADAEALIEDARRFGERAQAWSSEVSYGLQLYVLRRYQGRLGELLDTVHTSVEQYPTYPIWRCVLAQVTAELALEEASDHFAALARDGFSSLPFDETWVVATGLLAEAASSLGHRPGAAILLQRLLPYADRVAVSTPEVSTGAVARCLGLLAATLEDWDDAERYFEAAIELNGRIGARPWLAFTQRDYAGMLRERAAPGDAERADQLEHAARASAGELGLRL